MALNHAIVKPEKIVNSGLGILDQEVTVPNLFQKEDFANYAGAKDGVLNITVEGVLPFREWSFRSGEKHTGNAYDPAGVVGPGVDQTRQKIEFDRYVERTEQVTLSGAVYSGVELTDEQMNYDFGTWTDKITTKQIQAIGKGLQRRAVNLVVGADYEVEIGDLASSVDSEGRIVGALKGVTEARRVLNRFGAPAEGRVLLVGTDFETALSEDPNVKFASVGGDSAADTALREATLGRLKGFTVVTSNDIPAHEAYAFYRSAFVIATAAPRVPQSVKHGASAAYEGYALRWITDYSADYQVDRSVFMAYAGERQVKDLLSWVDSSGLMQVSTGTHFVRGIKLTLDGATVYPTAGSELAEATGIHTGPSSILFPDPDEVTAGNQNPVATPADD